MTAKEWLGVMQKAADFPKGMERLIEKYGEMLLKEQMQVNKNCVLPDVSGSFSLDFIKWYSGMEEQKILNAYERYKRESGNDR